MTYAAILVLASGDDDDVRAISMAADLARRHGAAARVISVFPPVPAGGWAEGFGGGVFTSELWKTILETNAETQKHLEGMARVVADQLGLTFGAAAEGPSLTVAPQVLTLWSGLMQELPLTDLVVAGPSSVARHGPWLGALDEAVMAGRAPMLVAREAAAPIDQPAVVAWDGSLQAGRAVRAAVPLLRHASKTLILQDPTRLDGEERDHADPERLAGYLRRKGVKAVSINRIKGEDGASLADAARAWRAGLLVAGAYGHSRLGEAMLGGATRAFLDSQDGPSLLIAH